ncbi:MAG: GNAT family N-acetyltransferase [Alphaproteobacteria bacterium]|nr:GNAT family N-acetyltransferase [Alphaproteobacteria bacterium]
MSLSFRRATAADLPKIIAMLADDTLGQAREILSDPPDDAYVKAFEAIEADANQFLAVADRDGEMVGTMQLSFVPGISHRGAWRGQIEAVRVAANQRGTGLGRQMMEWAIGVFRDKGCRLIQLTTDKSRKDAHRFYDGLGFTASHEGYKLKLD